MLLLSVAAPALAQVSLTTLDTPYTQNFDSLPASGSTTWTSNSTIPGWYSVRTGTGTTIAADTGTGNGGNLYSYGSASAPADRAIGSLGSGNATAGSFFHGVRLANNTGATITSLDVVYAGEQWRNSAAAAQTIAFSYLVGSPLVTGSLAEFQSAGTTVTSLDFTSPITGGTAGALDGNLAANRVAKSFTITGLTIPNGTEVMLRWSDPDQTGADHGLAIDNFSVTPHGAIAQPNLTINDVSANEGDAGTTTATFTVSLSQPAGAGGVTFDVATADGTSSAGSDYVANSLTTQTIPAGSSTYTFDVTINGDVTPEANETYFVNVTNVTGATVTDGQGLGTIVDNDAPHLSIADVSQNEGNAGTTSYVFTVSLTQPAGPGGVTFHIATADGSAVAPSDYGAQSFTGQVIPAGSSSYTFTVLVNGDATGELDETFNVNVGNVVNAIVDDAQAVGTILNDDITITRIHDVQGNGAATPIPGQSVTVEGVVTAVFLGPTRLGAFFLQEEDADADADPGTSEAVYVYCPSCAAGAVTEGQRVRVTGAVSEHFNMTELTASLAANVIVTDAGNHLAEVTPVQISLPVTDPDVNAFYEKYEGMLVTFADTLSISEFFELPRYGQIELLQGGRSRTFTEDNVPSVAGLTAHLDALARRRVILDDDNNVQNSVLTLPNGQQAMYWPHQNGGFGVGTQGLDYFRGGDTISGLTGVLDWSFAGLSGTDAWRVRPTSTHPVSFTAVNTRPAAPPDVGGSIRVVGMNLLNYFTTIDNTSSSNSGPCGPGGTLDCRGADSVAELDRQRERASIVICTLNPDVAGFMELENTTASATITDLLGAVNTRCGGAHPYAFANTGGTLGTDAIRVQIVYRSGVVSPVGSPLVDLDPIHDRPPTAQTFDVSDASNPAFGKRFTVIANHFKSKGSCPSAGDPNADQGDGQGCWAVKRTAQANRLMSWISSTVTPAAGDPDMLLLGDFNSYAHETPVTTLAGGGYADMETVLHGTNAYSYQFDGELGHLDYAFANPSMQLQVTGADAWHINSDEVPSFDYNDEIRDTGEAPQEEKPDGSALVPPRNVFEPATPYRASDHDPVVVGLFGATDLAASISDSPDPVAAGSNLTYTVTATNNGPAAATSTIWSDTLPTGTTFVSLSGVAGWSCTTPAVGAGGTVSCSHSSFAIGSNAFTLVVAVDSGVAGGTVLSDTVTVSSSLGDTNPANNSATATTTVTAAPQGHLTISPTALPFGNQNVGATSAAQTVTLGNDGSASLDVTALTAAAAPFARSGGTCAATTPITLAAGASCTLQYTFSPTAAGAASQTLTVTANAPGSGTIALNGTGVAVTHTVTPSVGTPSGTTSPNTAVVVNDGATTTFTLTPAGGFQIASVGGTCPAGSLAGQIYTTGAIVADCSVIANFQAIPNTPPAATVTPTSLSFTVQANQTGTQTLNIADAAGSDPLTFSITGQASRIARLLPHVSKSRHADGVLRSTGTRTLRAGTAFHSQPAAWSPVDPNGGAVTFQADDGSYENGLAWSDGTTQNTALWLNRYTATGALTIGTMAIEWPGNTAAGGDVTGKTLNIVAYFDADADGNLTNAVRLGSNTPVTINGPDAFQNYTTNFVVPGAGDVYLGFVDTFAAGGATPPLYAAALDTNGNPNVGWVAAKGTGDADVDVIGNNDNIGTLSGVSNGALSGVWMVRGTATSGPSVCSGAPVGWLGASPASGTVAGGTNTNVTITADPSGSSLAPGAYTAVLCVTTNDPAHALVSVPVSLTVTPAPFVPCSAADEIFCDGFDPTAGPFTQPVQDAGFEATTADGDTNPDWDSLDTNAGGGGGSVFYSASGLGIPTHGGDFAAWFGGWGGGAEVQHFSQSVTLPNGGPLYLNYWRFVSASPDVVSNLVVSVDGTAVQTTDLSTQSDADYALQSVDISSYADGAPHVIRFEYTYDDSGTTDGNTFVDDVTIDQTQTPIAY